MFNKRETSESEISNRSEAESQTSTTNRAAAAVPARSGGASTDTASIGPSISIDGTLKGEEDLVVEGRIKGTVELKSHTLTVGAQGTLNAEVYAHTIFVEGTVNGDLYASERVSIRKSARIKGNILAPRISLEDGAKFRGSIDMDADSEALRKAFGAKSTASSGASSSSSDGGSKSSNPNQGDKGGDKGKPGAGPQPASSANAAGSTNGKTGTSAA